MSKLTLHIIGDNNKVLIKPGAEISDSTIFISGNNHTPGSIINAEGPNSKLII